MIIMVFHIKAWGIGCRGSMSRRWKQHDVLVIAESKLSVQINQLLYLGFSLALVSNYFLEIHECQRRPIGKQCVSKLFFISITSCLYIVRYVISKVEIRSDVLFLQESQALVVVCCTLTWLNTVSLNTHRSLFIDDAKVIGDRYIMYKMVRVSDIKAIILLRCLFPLSLPLKTSRLLLPYNVMCEKNLAKHSNFAVAGGSISGPHACQSSVSTTIQASVAFDGLQKTRAENVPNCQPNACTN